ncbi:hypothetical protein RUND412_006075 [Rhizina undulata]
MLNVTGGKGRVRQRWSLTKTAKQTEKNTISQRKLRKRINDRIESMEENVRDFGQMEESLRKIMEDNCLLRKYALALQYRLYECQGEDAVLPPHFPLLNFGNAPPPPAIDPNVQQQMVQQQQQPQVAVPQNLPPQQHAPPASMTLATSLAPTGNLGVFFSL